MGNKNLSQLALVLVVVGALNWGLVGAFEYNLVAEVVGLVLSGQTAVNVERAVYVVVGLAGLYQVADLAQSKK